MADVELQMDSFYYYYPNTTYPEPHPGPAGVIVPVTLAIITILALWGNSLVIFIVLRYRNMRSSVTNFYIMNVAISDIVFVVVCAPLTSVLFATTHWPFGEFFCKLNAYVQCVSVQATCTTLTVMTVDRYYVIMCPLSSRRTRTIFRAGVVCASIWIFSAIVHIPIAFLFDVEEQWYYGKLREYCLFSLEDRYAIIGYYLYMCLSTFVIPLLIIAVCYILILSHLWKLSRVSRTREPSSNAGYGPLSQNPRSAGLPPAQSSARTASKTWKTTRIVLCVVMLFAVCWAPKQALNVWNAFDHETHRASFHIFNANVFCLCLTYANSCINPFVYALAGTSYRHHLRQMVSGNPKRGRSVNSRFSPTGGANSSYRSEMYRSPRRLSRTEATSVSTCV
ncbi:G-protein coupled receptor 54-like [Patiria miniata]|uniref:G-protein coupled receptors family 1 profile domain-containing protein n=1 Tax=Patiria miniata TaxID=46514 RepID=A0A914BTG6_PATMI|nr:G-protein coupled receptor 54-like [Patiria miniata]